MHLLLYHACFLLFDNRITVLKIHTAPSHSIATNDVFNHSTETIAADNGSIEASILVSEALMYFKLSI